MDVNSINNNISNLSSLSQQQLQKSSENRKIEAVSNDALNLTISESYNLRRDELSNSLQTFNNGIAITKIAQNALDKQQEILTDIKTKLQDDTTEDKNSLKSEIINLLKDFTLVAENTKYKKETILSTKENSYESNSFSIETKEANFEINKINTPLISNDLATTIQKEDLNNPETLNSIVEKIDNSSKYLNDTSNNFKKLSEDILENAKDVLKQQQDLAIANSTNHINFGKEANDFTKNNLFANMGYLAVSQANIVQEQSVRLLS
ncbi:hypothetical protein CRU99_05920 [Malaciobacter mytili]|uniref:flagellin N-terminal helical domain-containing protein n=1 Tax=Malaciobacter mytili TaxID=603050 RepID=UPI00100BEBDF|nr:hypothetical protein [Malaciobacter mytili]RXI43958.1 hypothetical protein CRU99_05920 [Malaciobacter mytili]